MTATFIVTQLYRVIFQQPNSPTFQTSKSVPLLVGAQQHPRPGIASALIATRSTATAPAPICEMLFGSKHEQTSVSRVRKSARRQCARQRTKRLRLVLHIHRHGSTGPAWNSQ